MNRAYMKQTVLIFLTFKNTDVSLNLVSLLRVVTGGAPFSDLPVLIAHYTKRLAFLYHNLSN